MRETIPHTESLLLRQIGSGDATAFTEVYKTYYPWLVSTATKIVKITHVAEDVCNDIFLNLWKNRQNLEDVQCLNAYLFTAVRHRSINALKAIARSQKALTEVQKFFPNTSIDTETHSLSKEYRAFVEKGIASLPPKARKVFTLCREEGLSYDQVATELGISRNAVKGHMVASMKKLRTFAQKDLGISFTLLFFLLLRL